MIRGLPILLLKPIMLVTIILPADWSYFIYHLYIIYIIISYSVYVTCCRKKDHPVLRFQPRFDVSEIWSKNILLKLG